MLYEEGSPFVATIAGDVPRLGVSARRPSSRLLVDARLRCQARASRRFGQPPATTVSQLARSAGARDCGMSQISKDDIIAQYPQTQEVVPVIPVLP